MGGYSLDELVGRKQKSTPHKTSSEVNNVLQLPAELLVHILTFLPGKDISKAASTCKAFYEASRVDLVWSLRCSREFGIVLAGSKISSCLQVYSKILYRYGKLMGLWHIDFQPYGGLLQVKFEGGRIIGIEWRPSKSGVVFHPLRKEIIFSIEASSICEPDILCLRGAMEPHKMKISWKRKDMCFFSQCCDIDKHKNPSMNEQDCFNKWLAEETTTPLQNIDQRDQELYLMKYLTMKQYANSFENHLIKLPSKVENAIIQPGLFKGVYGAHGIEIVLLTYEDDGLKVKAQKITGDPNVPANQISFRADLRFPLILNESEQQSIENLIKIRAVASPIPTEKLCPQPFVVPQDCWERGVTSPRQCKARFHGQGRIAGFGFTNSSLIPGHWIVFNEDQFGFLWLDLLSISMFHRVLEPIFD